MEKQNIVNPFSPECRYWVALDGGAWGLRQLPGPVGQIGADSIYQVNVDRQTLDHWRHFLWMNDAEPDRWLFNVPVLEPECGVTSISLINAHTLLVWHGEPVSIDFKANTKLGDWTVTMHWKDCKWVFTGFAWGYGGEGPAGLQRLMNLIGMDLDVHKLLIDKFGKTDCEWINPNPQ